MVCPSTCFVSSWSMSISRSRAWPFSNRCMTCSAHLLPSRHGVHWPQLSWRKKVDSRPMARTTSALWSITITAAVPRPDWLSFSPSKSMIWLSQTCLGKIGVEAPPGMTAFRLSQPPRTPPQWRSISSRREMLISSSTTQGLLTCPDMQKSFVPEFLSRPNEANQLPPRRQMVGATATVSTLATVDGHPKRPTAAGNGGFNRGLPGLPSRDSIREVSSPQMYAFDRQFRH